MKIVHSKKVQGAVLVLIVVCILFIVWMQDDKGKILSKEVYITEVIDLVRKEKNQHKEWIVLLEDMQGSLLENPAGTELEGIAFEDTCNQIYIDKLMIVGQSFIDMQEEFISLEVEGKQESQIPNYQQYIEYFEAYKNIGEVLQALASDLKKADYYSAIECLEAIQELNKKIPVIE